MITQEYFWIPLGSAVLAGIVVVGTYSLEPILNKGCLEPQAKLSYEWLSGNGPSQSDTFNAGEVQRNCVIAKAAATEVLKVTTNNKIGN